MILYTNIPSDIIMTEQNINISRLVKRASTLYAVSNSSDGFVVERVISTNPKDFLKKENTPGSKLK